MTKPSPAFTLTQAQYFVRVAELGSMTEAATELYVAQSAISASIAQLETSLGCRLFTRQRARGVALTEQGHTFHHAARRILASVDDAVGELRPGALTGAVSVGVFTTLAPFWLPKVFEQLQSAHPNLNVRFREITADEVEPLLQRRELEAVLTYGFDYGRLTDFTPVSEAPVFAAVCETHPLAERHSVTLAELAQLPLVLLDLGKSSSYFISLFQAARLTPNILARFGSYEVVRSMAGRGHGYCLLNQRPTHDLTNDGNRLITLPVTDAPALLQVGVAHRSQESMSRRGEAFLEACRTALSPGR